MYWAGLIIYLCSLTRVFTINVVAVGMCMNGRLQEELTWEKAF